MEMKASCRFSIVIATVTLSLLFTTACTPKETTPLTSEPTSAVAQTATAKTGEVLPPATAVMEPVGPEGLVTDQSGFLPDHSALYFADVVNGGVVKVKVVGAEATYFGGSLPDGRVLTTVGEVVYALDLDSGGNMEPLWRAEPIERVFPSPSGRLIARSFYTSDSLNPKDPFIAVFSMADKAEVFRIPIQSGTSRMLWAPDEEHLLYQSPYPGNPNQYAMSIVSPREPQSPLVLEEPLRDWGGADWSPEGAAVLFPAADGVIKYTIETGERTIMYRWPEERLHGKVSVSSVSGHVLVWGYTLNPPGASAPSSLQAVVFLGDGRGIQISGASRMAWSPKEDVLLTIANYCTDRHEIWLIGSDGKVLSVLGSSIHPDSAQWSSDGTQIMYEHAYAALEERVTTVSSVEGGEEHVIRRMPGVYQTTWWSPNGRWILFSPHAAGICEGTSGRMSEIRPFP